ncbi:hypothetical protein [Coleofasciculus sp. FACHB-1120]|uniref:hypothetical protein n=1 Tax=Coleofasciculus sp. FACHB-1120 TaxID=2692783 RepID=UPI0016871B0B|nr:hypothetical protein [Coleofasciculus sp. FACHB-1120]MBD2744766.1 hypothetical protein [Coleofasciculus sp. FACHB-1120]
MAGNLKAIALADAWSAARSPTLAAVPTKMIRRFALYRFIHARISLLFFEFF